MLKLMKNKIWVIATATFIVLAVVIGFVYAYARQNDNSVDYTQAPKYVGQHITVRGKIVSTSYREGTDFLDFCADYTHCPLSLVVLHNNTAKFGDVGKYSGNNIKATGTVSTYQGRTEILLSDPNQIKLE
jgi:hypothetical protein